MCQLVIKDIQGIFHGCFKIVVRVFYGCFMGGSILYSGFFRFKGVSIILDRCFCKFLGIHQNQTFFHLEGGGALPSQKH